MFEGMIAAQFGSKMFEKEIFKIVKRHAFWGALFMAIPDFGFGGVIFAIVLWKMYSKLAEKCGVSFSDNFWKLAGLGFIVNVAVAFVLDIALSFVFFLMPFVSYAQFYLSGKLFYETVKKFRNSILR